MDHERIQYDASANQHYGISMQTRSVFSVEYTVGLLFYFWKIEHGKRTRVRVTRRKAVRSSVPRPLFLADYKQYSYRFFRKRTVSLSALLCTSYRHNGGYDEPGYKERFPWRLISLVTTLGSSLNTHNVVYEVYRAPVVAVARSKIMCIITLILNLPVSSRNWLYQDKFREKTIINGFISIDI